MGIFAECVMWWNCHVGQTSGQRHLLYIFPCLCVKLSYRGLASLPQSLAHLGLTDKPGLCAGGIHGYLAPTWTHWCTPMESCGQSSWLILPWESLLHASIHRELFPSYFSCRVLVSPSALHLLLEVWSSSTFELLGIPHAKALLSLRRTLLDVKKVEVHLTCLFHGILWFSPCFSPSKPLYSSPISWASPRVPGLTLLAGPCQVQQPFSEPLSSYLEVQKLYGRNSPPASEHRSTIYKMLLLQVVLSSFRQLFPQTICLQKKGQERKVLNSDSSTL